LPTATSAWASCTDEWGDRQQSQEHLTTVTTMYRERDMRFWLAQGEAEVRELV
jgi:hypothetical protein